MKFWNLCNLLTYLVERLSDLERHFSTKILKCKLSRHRLFFSYLISMLIFCDIELKVGYTQFILSSIGKGTALNMNLLSCYTFELNCYQWTLILILVLLQVWKIEGWKSLALWKVFYLSPWHSTQT